VAAQRDAALGCRVIDEIRNAGDLDLTDRLFAPTDVNHAGLSPTWCRAPRPSC
jgi:hypothetical protein